MLPGAPATVAAGTGLSGAAEAGATNAAALNVARRAAVIIDVRKEGFLSYRPLEPDNQRIEGQQNVLDPLRKAGR